MNEIQSLMMYSQIVNLCGNLVCDCVLPFVCPLAYPTKLTQPPFTAGVGNSRSFWFTI